MPSIEELNQQIIAFLRQDELDYPSAAKTFGAEALPLLKALIDGNDENLAINAAYLAGYIKDDSVNDIIINAASNKFAAVRIAAAYGSQHLDKIVAAKVLEKSIVDADPGVLKIAIKSIDNLNISKAFKLQLNNVSKIQPNEQIKGFAAELIKKIK